MQWHYVSDGKAVGPVAPETLRQMMAQGELAPTTLIWREGMEGWETYSSVAVRGEFEPLPQAASLPPAPPQAPWVQSPGANPYAGAYGQPGVWGHGQPATAQPVVVYGGFWRRFGARFVDGIILGIPFNLLSGRFLPTPPSLTSFDESTLMTYFQAAMVLSLYYYLVQGVYFTILTAAFGGTPGKLALGMHVVRPDGSPIGYMRSLGRYLMETIVSGTLTLGIGYLVAAGDSERRTLHDRICDTRVVMK